MHRQETVTYKVYQEVDGTWYEVGREYEEEELDLARYELDTCREDDPDGTYLIAKQTVVLEELPDGNGR